MKLASRHARWLLPLACLTASLLAPACETLPPPVVERAPAAAQPSLVSAHHTAGRPSRSQGSAAGPFGVGALTPVKACPFDPSVGELPRGGGLLVKVRAPVPTEIAVRVETPMGQRRLAQPEELADEQAWARRGQGYFYEDAARTRLDKTGAVVERELAIWPGTEGAAGRFDLFVKTLSYDLRATGEERESASLALRFVASCADLGVEFGAQELSLRQGESRRTTVLLRPLGEGVLTMKTQVELAALPGGVTARLAGAAQVSTDWSNPRTTVIDLTAARRAPPGTYTVEARARLGSIERTTRLELTVVAVPEE